MAEKEVILDLSKKIKFYKGLYVSIGSLLLSGLILVLQGLTFGWSWVLVLNFVYSIRSGKMENSEPPNT